MDQSGQSGQGGRPGDPTGSTGGTSSDWQSTPGSTAGTGGGTSGGSTGTTGGTTGAGTTGGTSAAGTTGGTSGGWQSTTPSAGSSAPPTWQSTPEQTPAQTGGSWSRPTGSVPGTAGYFYADVPNRVIAFIIDFVVLILLGIVVGIIGAALGLVSTDPTNPFAERAGAASIIVGLLALIVNAAYFILTWTYWRGSAGMRVLGMQVGHETDGRTLTLNESTIRWALLWGPFAVGQLLTYVSVTLGGLVSLAGIVWLIVLLVTMAQSPTKQGLHDRYAHTVVVKAGRSVG